MALIVGITGGSASGKTFIAEEVCRRIGKDAAVVCQDWFFKEYSEIPKDSSGLRNFDLPENFEWEMIREALESLKAGKGCTVPKFGHLKGRNGFKEFGARQVIVFEGFLAFANPEVNRLFDLKVFVKVPESERFRRRLFRDVNERKIPEENVKKQWNEQVLKGHWLFVEPQEKLADLVVDGTDRNSFRKVLQKISKLRNY